MVCLQSELSGLLKEAEVLEPVLVDLSACAPQRSAIGKEDDILGDPCISACECSPEKGCEEPTEVPALFHLSLKQLSCLDRVLDDFKSSVAFPFLFSFSDCDP